MPARRWPAPGAAPARLLARVLPPSSRAGEHSGHLGAVLERLADDLEERQTLKARLIGAALYPAIVTVVAIVIVIFLVSYVVPQVATVFAGSKQALPTLTVLMLAVSAAGACLGLVAAGLLF
jgi:general secretion pathway protein F